MATTATAARTPHVNLVLNLRQEPQERVRKVTAAHEEVEDLANGFVFKRLRSSAPPPPAAAAALPSSSHLLRTPAGALVAAQQQQQAATAAAAAAESPYADELEMPRLLGERLLAGLQALPDRSAPADRLLSFSASIAAATVAAGAGAAARQAAGSSGDAAAAAPTTLLHDVFADFQRALAAALQDGSIRLAPAGGAAAAAEDGEEVEQRCGGGGGTGGGGGYLVDLAARKAGLRGRLANFQKEEAEWQSLLEQVEQLQEQPPQQPAEAEAEAGAPGGGGGGGELAALGRLQSDMHRHLAMQVEGVCKLVGDVEEMVERANSSAQAVQAEYQADKLRAFPHVHSPARLIRALVRPSGKAAAAAAALPAADGKENATATA